MQSGSVTFTVMYAQAGFILHIATLTSTDMLSLMLDFIAEALTYEPTLSNTQ